MESLFVSQELLFGIWAVLFALVIAVVWAGARRQSQREVENLRDDLHKLLGDQIDEHSRLTVAGRAAEYADVCASVNRLLERVREDAEMHAAAVLANSAVFAGALDSDEAVDVLFADVAAVSPEIILVHSESILFANDSAAAIFGLEPDSLLGKPVTDILRPAYRSLLRRQIETVMAADGPITPLEVQLISTDQTEHWAELHSVVTQFAGETAVLTVARDISHRKSLEASLGRNKLQARVTLESIGEGVITTDTQASVDYMNEAAEQLLGLLRNKVVGKPATEFIALLDEVERTSLGDPVERCLNERRRISLGRRALLVVKGTDREFSVELTASPIRAGLGQVSGCVIIFHDVTEVRGLTREMSYQATHDALTGLVNRLEFERRLTVALELARIEGGSFVVAYLDLDRFKLVNDTSGHIAGDNLLQEIARKLKGKVRESDTIARVGGDEFAMLLAGCPLDKARQIADDLCHAISEHPFSWQEHLFDIGVSVGLVEAGSENGSAETLLAAADSACYVAKQRGRGGHHVYSARDENMARQTGEISSIQWVQSALRNDGFKLMYQPIVSLDASNRSGPAAELLLRLTDDSGTIIMPSQFLAAAQRYQLMNSIDRWVVRHAAKTIANGLPRLPVNRSCMVNLSGQTLLDESFLEFVVEVLDRTLVDPERICFEISEGAVMANLDIARRFISVLHGIGCKFAIDDFGSGVGSFTHLKDLDVDYVKIDGSFIQEIDSDEVSQEMVASMLRLSRQLNFRVIAEQVEDSAAFDKLREMGIDFIQGYVVERPRELAVH